MYKNRAHQILSVVLLSSVCLLSCNPSGGSGGSNIPLASSSPPQTKGLDTFPVTVEGPTFVNQQELFESGFRCATQTPNKSIRGKLLARLKRFIQNQRVIGAPEERAAGSITIPVYFHVINKGDGIENGDIPDQVIADQIDILNKSFSGAAGGRPTPFKFELKKIDRTTNLNWYEMAFDQENPTTEEREAKTTLGVKNKSVLNLYTAYLSGRTLGWARWPWDYKTDPNIDGVVVKFSTLPNGASKPYDEGDTATHEVGHWLGLLHTFEGGCDPTNDEVEDTPAEDSPAARCPIGNDTCGGVGFPGVDPVENFMDYSDDSCMYLFTAKQSVRMDDMHALYRSP